MNNEIPKKVIDVTSVALTPGEPDACLGNGKHGFACCCDDAIAFCFAFPSMGGRMKRRSNVCCVSARSKAAVSSLGYLF